jgi:very-short-patch-repair endonuclease
VPLQPESLIGAFINVPETVERIKRLSDLNDRWRAASEQKDRWMILRETYAIMLPLLLQRRSGPNYLDWAYGLSPIEQLAWMDIRYRGLPLYPQIPALHYFLDFADPVQQIAVELDGAAYHEYSRDLRRDTALYAQGWKVFRIPGKRSLVSKVGIAQVLYECQNDEECLRAVSDWGSEWSEGFFWALGYWYYGKHGISGVKPEIAKEAARRILYHHQLVEFPIGEDDE